MRLHQVLSNLASSLRSAEVARKTSSHLNRYRRSAKLTLSRLFGYRLRTDGTAEIVAAEAETIRIVIEALAAGRSVAEVKAALDKDGMRNRSGKRWSTGECMSLVRDIYAGLIRGPMGTSKQSTVYPPIVAARTLRKAQKTLKREVENASRPPSSRLAGGRNDAAVTEAALWVDDALETLISEDR